MILARPTMLVAKRELRQGKKTFVLSLITIMLAVTMLTTVFGLGDSLRTTLARDAKVILGGDFEIRLSARNFTTAERDWLIANSDRVSAVTTLRSAAIAADTTALVLIRVVDAAYPLFGEVPLADNTMYSYDLLQGARKEGQIPVVITSDLGAALGVDVGDSFTIGATTVRIIAMATSIPDPSTTMILNAPVIFMDSSALAATGLDQPGALRTARMKVDIGTRDGPTWRTSLNAAFPDNDWRIRGSDRVVPGLQDMIGRMETLMLLVSLGTMLIAGICVGNTVSTYLRARIVSIAVLKSLGMPIRQIRAAYLLITLQFVVLGSLLGIALGYLGQELLINTLAGLLPFQITSSFSLRNVTIVPVIALLTAWLFTIRPLQAFSSISPTNLFSLSAGHSAQQEPVVTRAWLEMIWPTLGLLLILVFAADDSLFLLYFGLGGTAAVLLFRALSVGMIKLAAKLHPRTIAAKIALRAVARSGGQIGSAAASLGVGLSALLTFSLTEANFNNQLQASLANQAPEYYLAGLQPGDADKIRTAAKDWLPNDEALLTLPTSRARITRFNSVSVEEIDAPENLDWIIRGDRYITWARDQSSEWTGTSRISEGEPWTSANEDLLVSFDAEAAEAFGLQIGDIVEVQILGELYELTIANLRRIDWATFDVNFVMVLSDGPWSQTTHGELGSVRHFVGEHHPFQRTVVKVAPSVIPIHTKTIIASVTNLLEKIGILLNIITYTATVAGVLVLAAAIAESRYRREHDSLVLRILGTSRMTLANAFRIEFLAIACLASLPAFAVAITASYAISHWLLQIAWGVDWGHAILVLGATLAIVMAMGSASTIRLTKTPPLVLLHNE